MPVSRRQFTRLLMASGAMLPLGSDGLFASPQNPRSVPAGLVLFLSDDLGFGDLHCYGNPINRTPNIDALASRGCRFTDAHSASPICSPARAALLTGRHPYRLGIYYLVERDVHLRREEISIATLLKSRGYDTCFVGKWHVSRLGAASMGQPTPSDFGFDHWFGTEHNAFEGPQNPRDFIRNGVSVGAVNGWYCDVIVREALDWLRSRRDQSRPFFIYACTHEPHTPVAPPDQYSAMYDTPEVRRLEMGMSHGGVPRPDSERPQDGRFYHGTVTQLDDAFGHLLAGIDAVAGRNVAVFFTSDNGPEYPVNWIESHGNWEDPLRDRSFGTPGPLRGMKRFTYEGGHRVPLIVRWPGLVKEGTVSDALVNGTDYLPTFCGIAGAHVPTDRTIDGASILPVFTGGTVDRRIPACWTFPVDYTFMPSLTMRDGDYVLAAWFARKPAAQLWMEYIKTAKPETYELYNLRTDIAQRVNMAERDPERVQRMAARLRELWASIQAEAPVWKEWDRR